MHMNMLSDKQTNLDMFYEMLTRGGTNKPKAVCQTAEIDAFARSHFPEKFSLITIDRNIEQILAAGGELMLADFEEFLSSRRYDNKAFDYEYDGKGYSCGLIRHAHHPRGRINKVHLNYNIKCNDDGFLYTDPAEVAPIVGVARPRQNCDGWVALDESAFSQLPHFNALCRTLTASTPKFRELSYNRRTEMLDLKAIYEDGTAIVMTFERWPERAVD